MKRVNHIHSLTGFLTVFFLFTSIISLPSYSSARNILLVSEKADASSKATPQFLYEEKEGESRCEEEPGHKRDDNADAFMPLILGTGCAAGPMPITHLLMDRTYPGGARSRGGTPVFLICCVWRI